MMGPVICDIFSMEARGESGQDSIETPFNNLANDCRPRLLHFPDRYSHYAALWQSWPVV